MYCSACEKRITPGAAYCPYCGYKLRFQVTVGRCCANCGAKLLSHSRFCTVCGLSIDRSPRDAILSDNFQLTFADAGSEKSESHRVGSSGLSCIEGDWIYYSSFPDFGRLYKCNTLTNENIKLTDDGAHGIYVDNGWIYYNSFDTATNKSLGLCRIRNDGTRQAKLNDSKAFYMNVVGCWIYANFSYDDNKMMFGLYKIRTDGSEIIRLTDYYCHHLCAEGGYLYYLVSDTDKKKQCSLYRLNSDTMQIKMLGISSYNSMIVANGCIYYSTVDQKSPNIILLSS